MSVRSFILHAPRGVPPWKTRPCRRCPAEAYGLCFRWRTERVGSSGAGRWERSDAPHFQRRNPGSTRKDLAPSFTDSIESCGDTSVHAYHRTGEWTWCRGRLSLATRDHL